MSEKTAYSRAAIDACSGGEDAHLAHLDMNDECPWCGAYTERLERLTVPQLRALARDKGLSSTTRLTRKAELLAALAKWEETGGGAK